MQDLLVMQNFAYETLVIGLRRLDPLLHRAFLVRTLNIVLDVNDLDALPTVELAGLMFGVLDFCREPEALLNINNIMQHVCGLLQTVYGGLIV